jgi:hypothetical protein
MSIKSFDEAHDYLPASETGSAGILGNTRLIWLAFTEGLVAQHRYETLRARGLAHTVAAKEAMALTQTRR